MGKQFTVNYGGPGVNMTTLPSQYGKVLDSCLKKYSGSSHATKFTLNGIDVTVFGTGIHRGIKVELPDSVEKALKSNNSQHRKEAQDILKRFVKAKAQASDFNTTDYKLWSNNCVSAVSNVLHNLDPSFEPKQTKPWTQDDEVEQHTKSQQMLLEVLNFKSKPEVDDPTQLDKTVDLSAPPTFGAYDALSSPQEIKQQLQQQKAESQQDNSAQDSTVEADAKKTF